MSYSYKMVWHVIQIKATPKFTQLAHKAMTDEKLQELIDWLAVNPETGTLIAGTGGIRKLRWQTGKNNKGKSIFKKDLAGTIEEICL